MFVVTQQALASFFALIEPAADVYTPYVSLPDSLLFALLVVEL